jgi:hypothetical protein
MNMWFLMQHCVIEQGNYLCSIWVLFLPSAVFEYYFFLVFVKNMKPYQNIANIM